MQTFDRIPTASRAKEVLVSIPKFLKSHDHSQAQVQDILCEIKPNQAMKILYDLDTAKDKD